MGTPNTPSLPIIDLSSFLDPNASASDRSKTSEAIDTACTDYGFFYLTGHGIPVEDLDQVIALARQFFSLSVEEKMKIKRHDAGDLGDGARGYQKMAENITLGMRDMQEAIDLYKPWSEVQPTKNPSPPYQVLQGPNLWPNNPSELEHIYTAYISRLKTIGSALVRAMGQALNLPAPTPTATKTTEDSEIFVRNTANSFWVMRMIGYPKLEQPNGGIGGFTRKITSPDGVEEDMSSLSCGEHTDYGCVTFLLADPTPGALQVLHKNGTWLYADPIPGAFVVNIGDMIERWTNGIWKSTRHRVIHRGQGYRVSVPFFFEPDWDAVVKPLGKCVERTGGEIGEKDGERYGEGTYGEHLLGKVFNNFYSEVLSEKRRDSGV